MADLKVLICLYADDDILLTVIKKNLQRVFTDFNQVCIKKSVSQCHKEYNYGMYLREGSMMDFVKSYCGKTV